ncbi:hypothetical protein HPB48_019097 [Haemaphysalis longicornis]|uniref:PIPK domain-containing protein n=1 Tax=Haemaphysalis longicornis TaxID=44386 RepID=A0A9J6G8X4_HAELO|nr:hypothetical protein HPB48_019097 [Haemaphysalis longicornis]
MLMPDDFKAFTKIKVDNHHFNKENMPSHFKVKEYCPLVFRNLRERFGIDDCVYMYVVERHGKTLLPQYLAMYRLTVEGAETYLVVIRNIFSSHLNVHVKYDLKGSTVDREASEKERFLAQMNVMDYSLCLGIHDVERAEQEALERERAEALMEEVDNGTGGSDALPQSEEDEDSAGSGLADAVPTPPDSPGGGGRFRNELGISNGLFNPGRDIYAISSTDNSAKKEVYFMALVDVLTHYGVKKRTAQAAKTMKHGAGAEISTVHPEQYAKRFLDFISKAMD